jgi:uncharacterized protein (DUF1778 family)
VDDVQIYFRVPRSMRQALEAAAAADDRPLSSYILRVLRQHLAPKETEDARGRTVCR